jgi:hypothetical protein
LNAPARGKAAALPGFPPEALDQLACNPGVTPYLL